MNTSKTLFAALVTLVLTAACSDAGPLAPETSSAPVAALPDPVLTASERPRASEPATPGMTTTTTATTVTTTEEVIDEEGRRCWIDLQTGAKRCRL